MKPSVLFLTGFLLGTVILAYTSFVPDDSPTSISVIAGRETLRLQRGEELRLILFFVVLVFVLVAVIFAFWKQRVAAALWSVVLAIVIIRALLPSFPVRLFPFAPAVFWGGLVVQAILCYSTFRALGHKPTAVATKTNTNE